MEITSFKKKLTWIILTVVTAGSLSCASGRGELSTMDIEIPNTWSNLEGLTIDPNNDIDYLQFQWWGRFDDPILIELIEEALSSNPDLAIASLRIIQAEQQLIIAGARKKPSADLGATTSKTTSSTETGTGGTGTVISTSLETSWELDLFGKTSRNIRATRAALAGNVATKNGIKIKLISDIALNYIDFRSTQDILKLQKQRTRHLDEILRLTENEVNAGLISDEQIEIAKISKLQSDALVDKKQTELRDFGFALDVLLGTSPGTTFKRIALSDNALKVPRLIALGIPAESLKQRPDVIEALEQVKVENEKIGIAKAKQLPSLTLRGSIGLEALSLNALGNQGSDFSSLRASILMPIFNAGELKAGEIEQVARRDEALENYKKTLRNGLIEVEKTLINLLNSRKQATSAEKTLISKNFEARSAVKQFTTGLKDYKDVLRTKAELTLVKQDKIEATRNELKVITRLYKALGGGWNIPKKQKQI